VQRKSLQSMLEASLV